jgi:cell division protein FtsN
METENRRMAWIGGILVVGVAVLLGWLVLTKKEKTPETPVMPAPILEDSSATQRELPVQEEPIRPAPQVVVETDGKYTVQVSSWRTRRRAEQDAERFSEKGFNAYVQSADIPELGGTWYRVRVGSYATQGEAREMAEQLAGLLESGFWLDRYRKSDQ